MTLLHCCSAVVTLLPNPLSSPLVFVHTIIMTAIWNSKINKKQKRTKEQKKRIK
jgi:hypothetical protein